MIQTQRAHFKDYKAENPSAPRPLHVHSLFNLICIIAVEAGNYRINSKWIKTVGMDIQFQEILHHVLLFSQVAENRLVEI